ncbi:Phage integrase family protein [Mycoavidus cysteinexigens]|uniref:Phage integrase family protein n=1 Tax=Mycoavidus cysteinexigens TaxID=1553431 RepID=A0A2Z6ET25_9BURK|nr:tyrosine-type recombinase/integrase [Mycoavidus cysteinexigens]BBE08559.1 Phage integrase family protein [Mycoavidus cysteinexigens]GAM52738.1 integrase [bacterium endosymbiont of Mortierella elongata FMR23-6]GLR00410.1 integrase [Mycoavidus cysteinexigens]
MGRKPSRNLNLPQGLRARHRKSGTYYYLDTGTAPRREIALGTDYAVAVKKWAELTMSDQVYHKEHITFRYVAEGYQREVLPKKALRTQKDNLKELAKLYEFFDASPVALDNIEPIHIRQYLDWRVKDTIRRRQAKGKAVKGDEGQVRANREKALLSHIWNFARERGLTEKPNPCAGIRGFKEIGRDTYVDDVTYKAVLTEADAPTRDAMELAYLTGQRPADVLKLARTDICDGAIGFQQNKTNKRLRIAIEGQLAELIERLTKPAAKPGKVRSLTLICSERGEALTALALRFRFEKAREKAAKVAKEGGQHDLVSAIEAFQFRDLRAKAGTDKEEKEGMAAAKDQLGHADEKMTQRYVRHRKGKLVTPTR